MGGNQRGYVGGKEGGIWVHPLCMTLEDPSDIGSPRPSVQGRGVSKATLRRMASRLCFMYNGRPVV